MNQGPIRGGFMEKTKSQKSHATVPLKKAFTLSINPNPDGYEKVHRKQGGLPVRAPFPCCTPIGRPEVLYDFQPAEMLKNTTTNRWLLLFD